MKKVILILLLVLSTVSAMAAYQYETKGNEGWLTFDSETTISFGLTRSGKDKDHENFVDRGNGVADYGWYNMETGESGSFAHGATATFNENDKIGLYVKDNEGNVFTSSKKAEINGMEGDIVWGKVDKSDEIALYGGNKGSNGTHEYYVFKVNTVDANNKTPSGQPLPGIIATLLVGGVSLVYLKKRKKLIAAK